MGGCTIGSEWEMGVHDQSEIELRDDILVYTSNPLPKKMEITGPIRVNLFSSTSAKGFFILEIFFFLSNKNIRYWLDC